MYILIFKKLIHSHNIKIILNLNGIMKLKFPGRPFNIVLFYVHRFLRIIPILVTALLFFATLARHIGNGPMWKLLFPDEKDCAKNWWTSLIFIDNYKNLMDRVFFTQFFL